MNLAKKMKSIWNNVSERQAHLGESGEREEMYMRYKEHITDAINVDNKIIIDFGFGGGLLGEYLFKNHSIKKYIGYDISERSYKKASSNLKDYKNKELILLEKHQWDFKAKKPNVIVCLACMIHFPTQIYMNNFLSDCNISGGKYLILEIRDEGKIRFFDTPYVNKNSVIRANSVTSEYVAGKLCNYTMINETERSHVDCKILTFEKKHGTILA